MFAENIVLYEKTRKGVEMKAENWRRVVEERSLREQKGDKFITFNEMSDEKIEMQVYTLTQYINYLETRAYTIPG